MADERSRRRNPSGQGRGNPSRRKAGGAPRGDRARGSGAGAGRGGRPGAPGGRRTGSKGGSGGQRRPASGRDDRSRPPRKGGRDRRESEHQGRHGKGSQPRSGQRRAFSVDGGSANLPKWLREEIQRVTSKDRQEATLQLLSEAASDFADEKFVPAHRKLLKAKNLSSRASAIRELLGLTSYRLGNWEESLRELRAFRRFTGDTTHMPIELDTLRALGRSTDVEKTWDLFMELGGHPATDAEARVVYGSYLMDEGRIREAWGITKPSRTSKDSKDYERRRWFVAARAALALGDADTALTLVNATREGDPHLPGLDDLTDEILAAKN